MSERAVWPYVFTLRVFELVEAYRSGAIKEITVIAGARGDVGIPVALRWLTVPELGIPRRPFEVYRRPRLPVPAAVVRTLVTGPITLTGPTVDLPFPPTSGDLIYLASITATPTAGQALEVTAYDLYGNAIPGQQYTVTSGPAPTLVGPGMAGLRVAGVGTVNAVYGVSSDDYANLPDWQLTQVVGLPTLPGQTGAAYDSVIPQGYAPAHLDGYAAAVQRLEIATLARGTPPPTGNPAVPLPPWPASSPGGYLNSIRSAGNLLPMITACLASSVDSDPSRMQSLYTETVTVDGVKQANLPGATADPTRPSTVGIPVISMTMLGVGADCDSATALGYGTVDLPPQNDQSAAAGPRPPGAAVPAPTTSAPSPFAASGLAGGYDYLVTAPFVLPFGPELSLAALSQAAPGVEPVTGLGGSVSSMHAVLSRDSTAQVAATLTWQPSADPQGYALLASRRPSSSAFLNAPRSAGVGGFDPYLGLAPAVPDPNLPPDEQLPAFSDAAGQLPVDGTTATTYLVAGIDVFGQWSAWSEAAFTLSAAPVTQPGLKGASLVPGALPSSGQVIQADLVVEVLWDWTDRSPGVLQVTGEFVAPGTGLGPAYLSGLAMGNTGPIGPPLLLTWDYAGQDPATVAPDAILPAIDASHAGTVELLTDASGVAAGQVMQYRVTITGLALDFSSADEVDLALYVTATEQIRPGEWSDPQIAGQPGYLGQVARALNPFPPVLSFTPPAISWTALPDAYNRARGMLEWTSDPSAAGYLMWESTEGALLQLLSPGSPDPDPAASLVTRGATLKALVAANYEQALQSFSRLNTDPIQGSRTEIELPGSSSTLYAYMISAVSSQGVEAPRGPQIAVFGVPERLVPGQPRLVLRQQPIGSAGIQVIGLAVETGVVPAGYSVLRVRSATLAQEAGLMGPPKILPTDPGWQSYTDTPLHGGTTASGQSVLDGGATASWYPYYYRVIAIGPDDPANGKHSGQSLPSGVQSAYCLPPDPPLLTAEPLAQGYGAALLVSTADLPIPASPLAPSLVELLQAGPDPQNPGRTVQQTVLSAAPDAITEGTLALPRPIWWPPVPSLLGPPHVRPAEAGPRAAGEPAPGIVPAPPLRPPPPPFLGPALARSAPGATGTWTLYVLVPYGAADVNTYTVRLTDPLGRQSAVTF